ncbi:MAG: hypothetical protein ACFE91_01135 [Promethearchaeota archaeon]
MKSMMFEPLPDTDFSIHLMEDLESDASGKSVENLVSQIRDLHVNFATIDLGNSTLREFENTPLAMYLKKLGIPYFTIELPYYVKDHFTKQINEIKEKYYELKATYDILEEKQRLTAQELNGLINYYSNELKEINNYINMEIRTKSIFKKLLSIIRGKDNINLTFLHFGERDFFMGIFSQTKRVNYKSQFLIKK